jgi:hypothetical protein
MMHRVPQDRLTLPAVAGRGLSEGLGRNREVTCLEGVAEAVPEHCDADPTDGAGSLQGQ